MDFELAICGFDLPDGVPEWVHIMPLGKFNSVDGRDPWILKDATAVISQSLSRGRDLVFDYEHQTDHAVDNGQPAPAAGWIKELEARTDGIWARVEWTPRAKEMLADREYRYLSPTFTYTKSGRVVTRILRVALTNDPALNLTALAAVQHSANPSNPNGDHMNELIKRLMAILGQTGEMTEEALCTLLTEMVANAASTNTALAAIADTVGLTEAADATEIATAVASVKSSSEPDPTKFVTVAQFQEVNTALASLQSKLAEGSATAAVDAAVEAGKITPANRSWALTLAKSDMGSFNDFLKNAPVLAGAADMGGKAEGGAALSEAEIAICRATGVSEENFKKQKEADAK